MADIKWIKICTDIFDDEKILLIENLPEGDTIIVCWLKLLCLAGKQNNCGVFLINERIPYTEEMLATIFRRPLNTVKLALQTFANFGMIEIVNNTITIPNWEKHQSLDKMERLKEQSRQTSARYRAKQKQLQSASYESDVTRDITVTSRDTTDKNRLDKTREDKNNITISEDIVCQTETVRPDVKSILDAWNALSDYGIKPVSKMNTSSKRYQSLCARIKEHGVEFVLKAIENIKCSDFLQGKSKDWIITFDWFVKPNNFPKVLEGNYDNRNGGNKYMRY